MLRYISMSFIAFTTSIILTSIRKSFALKVVYTPMISARVFADPGQKIYREEAFNMLLGEEGGQEDRPLFIQVQILLWGSRCGSRAEMLPA